MKKGSILLETPWSQVRQNDEELIRIKYPEKKEKIGTKFDD